MEDLQDVIRRLKRIEQLVVKIARKVDVVEPPAAKKPGATQPRRKLNVKF